MFVSTLALSFKDVAREEESDVFAQKLFQWDLAVKQFRKIEQKRIILSTPKEIDLLHGIWLQLSNDVAPEEIHHHDVVHFALEELKQEMNDYQRDGVVNRLRQHLLAIQTKRKPDA